MARTITRQLMPYGVPSRHRRPVIVTPDAIARPNDLATVPFTHEHRPSYTIGHLVDLDDRGHSLWATVEVDDSDLGDQVLAEDAEDLGAFSIELSPWTADHTAAGTLTVREGDLVGITWTRTPMWPDHEVADDAAE